LVGLVEKSVCCCNQ